MNEISVTVVEGDLPAVSVGSGTGVSLSAGSPAQVSVSTGAVLGPLPQLQIAAGTGIVIRREAGVSTISSNLLIPEVAGVSWTTPVPQTSGDEGTIGGLAYDDNYIYVRTSVGWRRAELASFPIETFVILTENGDSLTTEQGAYFRHADNSDSIRIVGPSGALLSGSGTAEFSVDATATTGEEVALQWQTSIGGGGTWVILPGETQATLALSGLTAADIGRRYRVVASTPGLGVKTSVSAELSPQIIIDQQPADQTSSAGQATFSVVASATGGGELTYSWQRLTPEGTAWEVIQSGASPTLALSGLTLDEDDGRYRVMILSPDASDVVSAVATLTVPPPFITINGPVDQDYINGDATFSVTATASNGAAVSYEWQRQTGDGDWGTLAGSPNQDTLVLTGLEPSEEPRRYRVVVSADGVDPKTSDSANLVMPSISIDSQPVDAVASLGVASFSASASASNGQAPAIQWQVSFETDVWIDVFGATGSLLQLEGLEVLDGGSRYRAVASLDGAANAVTDEATLSVPRDTITLVGLEDQSAVNGDATFTVSTTAERVGAATLTATQFYYRWERSSNGGNSWSFVEQSGPTSSLASSYTLSGLAQSPGDLYRVRVTAYRQSAVYAYSSPATVIVDPPAVTIVEQPDDVVYSGQAVEFAVFASVSQGGSYLSAPSPEYLWEQSTDEGVTWETVPLNPAFDDPILTFPAPTTFDDDGKLYRATVSADRADPVLTRVARLTVPAALLQYTSGGQPQDATAAVDGTASFSVSAVEQQYQSQVTYQWQSADDATGPWADLEGATGGTLSLSGVKLNDDGDHYRVVVTAATPAGDVQLIGQVLLSVPQFELSYGLNGSLGPQDRTISSSDSVAKFDGLVADFSPYLSSGLYELVYQWQRLLPGTTEWQNIYHDGLVVFIERFGLSNELSVYSEHADQTQYRLFATVVGAVGEASLASDPATLTIGTPVSPPSSPSVPQAPQNLSASIESFGTVRLSWSHDASVQTDSYLMKTVRGGVESYQALPADQLSVVIDRLQPGQYEFSVLARNDLGDSPYTPPLVFDVPDLAVIETRFYSEGYTGYGIGEVVVPVPEGASAMRAWVAGGAGGMLQSGGTQKIGRGGLGVKTFYDLPTAGSLEYVWVKVGDHGDTTGALSGDTAAERGETSYAWIGEAGDWRSVGTISGSRWVYAYGGAGQGWPYDEILINGRAVNADVSGVAGEDVEGLFAAADQIVTNLPIEQYGVPSGTISTRPGMVLIQFLG